MELHIQHESHHTSRLSIDDVLLDIMLGAAVVTCIAVTPYLNTLNYLLGCGTILGGYVTAKRIIQHHHFIGSRQRLALFSAYSGALGGLFSTVVATILLSLTFYDVTQPRSVLLAQTILYAKGIQYPSNTDQRHSSSTGGLRIATEKGQPLATNSDGSSDTSSNTLLSFVVSLAWTVPLYALLASIGGYWGSLRLGNRKHPL
jgi:hypothetical protein